jgi:hypothetical protein
MVSLRIVLYYIIFICLFSCDNSEKHPLINSKKNVKLNFLSDHQVEKLINQHDCIYLSSYWVGMSHKEAMEITRYLMDRKILTGIIYNVNEQKEFSINRFTYQKTLNIDTFLMTQWFVRLKTTNYDLNAKTYFDFNSDRQLEQIWQKVENTNSDAYQELLDLYKQKYGEGKIPFYKDEAAEFFNISNGYSIYVFTNDYQQIKVEYIPKNSGIFDKNKSSEINITYEDLNIIKKKNLELNNQMKNREELKKQQIENRKKDVLKTLEKI